jgi:hypothetical protein
MKRSDLLRLARLGAESRIAELQREIEEIRRRFHLGRGSSSALGSRGPAAATAGAPRKRKMSAAGRKRIGDAARRRWAAWRKAHPKA